MAKLLDRYLSNLLADAQRRIATIEHDLRQGLAKGRYNLRELADEQRYYKAKLYMNSMDNLRRLERISSLLQSLRDERSPG